MQTHAFHNRHSRSIAFGANLPKRLEKDRDSSLVIDLQKQIRGLPLLPSSTLTVRQDELDRLGTELWNLSTRLRRDEPAPNSKAKDDAKEKNRSLCLVRTFAFLVLDSAAAHAKGRPRKSCIRLMKVALKAARVCITSKELDHATKILGRAAEYQEVLSKEGDVANDDEGEMARRLRMEYFAVRTTLVSDVSLRPSSHADARNNRHGDRIAWTQQSICMPSASSSPLHSPRAQQRPLQIFYMRWVKTA